MNGYTVSLLFAFFAGVLAATQGTINSLVGKTAGQYVMIIGVSLIQALLASLLLFRSGGTLPGPILPWIMAAGIMGVGIMFGVSASIPTIGALTAFVLLILGQIVASALIDHFGWFGVTRAPITLQKIGSLLVILAGVYWLVKS
jgi:transporter family-2 protein